MAECLCVGSMGGRELAVKMALVLSSVAGHLRGSRPRDCCGGRRCCSNVLLWLRRSSLLQQRVARTRIVCFGSPNTASCCFEYLFTPRQQNSQIAHMSKSTRKLLHMVGHPSTSRCIFQDLEIPGRIQQHQITIIFLGRPYSSSITNTLIPCFR